MIFVIGVIIVIVGAGETPALRNFVRLMHLSI